MSETTTETMIVKCRCSTARVLASVVLPRRYLAPTDANVWVRAAVHGSYTASKDAAGFEHSERFACLRCGSSFKVESVRARRTSHVCNARCLSSTSGKCECSCGGKNHGGAYA